MAWHFFITDLTGAVLGRINNAYEYNASLNLTGPDTVRVRMRLEDPLVQVIKAENWDVLVKLYQDNTLRLVGELVTAEEYGGGMVRAVDRSDILTQGYVLGDADYKTRVDSVAVSARGLFEAVVPESFGNPALQQAWVNAQVAVKAAPRQIVTFEPTGDNDRQGVTCNFSSALWRLQKRLSGKQGSGETFSDTARGAIIQHLVEASDDEWGHGIVVGTVDALYNVSIDEPWWMKPIAEGITELAEVLVVPLVLPGTHTIRDSFDTPTGPMCGPPGLALDAPPAHTWGGTGDTDDFTVPGSAGAHRIAGGDTAGRFNVVNGASAILTDTLVTVDFEFSELQGQLQGVLARFADAANCLAAVMVHTGGTHGELQVQLRTTARGTEVIGTYPITGDLTEYTPGVDSFFYNIILQVDASGDYAMWFNFSATTAKGDGLRILGHDDDLATGGALEDGQVGLLDYQAAASATNDRVYANFGASAPTVSLIPQDMNLQFVPEEPTQTYGTNSDGSNKHKIATLNVLQSVGSVKPNVVFEPGKTSPAYGSGSDQYLIGDTVTAKSKYPDGTERLNGMVRIHGVDIEGNNEKATETPRTVPT